MVYYYCERCGLIRKVPDYTPLWCCGALMERVNGEAARKMMEGEGNAN